MADYYEAVQQILIRDDAIVPRRFELGPSGEKQFKWRGGQCVIGFFDNQPLLTDAIPIVLVAHVAALIANDCINEAKGYGGGYAHIGPNLGFVAVTQFMPPDINFESDMKSSLARRNKLRTVANAQRSYPWSDSRGKRSKLYRS